MTRRQRRIAISVAVCYVGTYAGLRVSHHNIVLVVVLESEQSRTKPLTTAPVA